MSSRSQFLSDSYTDLSDSYGKSELVWVSSATRQVFNALRQGVDNECSSIARPDSSRKQAACEPFDCQSELNVEIDSCCDLQLPKMP